MLCSGLNDLQEMRILESWKWKQISELGFTYASKNHEYICESWWSDAYVTVV